MFNRILVPLDQSLDSERSLGPATELAKASGGRIVLLTVVEPLAPSDEPDLVQIEERRRQRAALYLEKQAAAVEAEGVPDVRREARFGDPSSAILDVARAENADLIVMGSHGLGGAHRYPLGSVALRVLMAASCPVLTIRASSG